MRAHLQDLALAHAQRGLELAIHQHHPGSFQTASHYLIGERPAARQQCGIGSACQCAEAGANRFIAFDEVVTTMRDGWLYERVADLVCDLNRPRHQRNHVVVRSRIIVTQTAQLKSHPPEVDGPSGALLL